MAACTQLGGLDAEESSARIVDVVHAMTIRAHRDIRIVFLDQSGPMYAVFIGIKNIRVTLAARFRYV
ncbi:MAG: hypothetical protein A2Z14_07050 [Chloroflexi bacterium RBG_16_48_8]|nr:MAG: hypothetical protein A2Z14_07050 [Chloroflexi bacterium RBG_16_48_8]